MLLLIIAFPVKSLAGTSHSESRIGSLQAKVTVSGIVTDKNGSPLIGAGVFEKGTTNGTVTDNDGSFSLSVSPNAVLVVSNIGYINKEIPIGASVKFNIVFFPDKDKMSKDNHICYMYIMIFLALVIEL